MKKSIITYFLLAMLYPCLQQAQKTYQFEYDAVGNRTLRRVVIIPPPPQGAPPVKALKSEFAEETQMQQPEVYEETIAGLDIKVYPNPTRGKLRVAISSQEEIQNSQLELYTPNGKTIFKRSHLGNQVDIDITDSPSGIYLMQIQVNKTISRWKIVKQ